MDRPAADPRDVACHVKGCDESAVRACDQCDRPFCAVHVQPHTIERRAEPDERGGLLLTRVPTYRETLYLCRYCGTKPIVGKHPPTFPDLQAIPPEAHAGATALGAGDAPAMKRGQRSSSE